MNKIKALWRFFCLGEIYFVSLYQILKQQLIIKLWKQLMKLEVILLTIMVI
jgi:hypothetical protein